MTIRCAIVGATGIAGQQFLAALANHPFIKIVRLAASERSAGKKYKDAITTPTGGIGWYVDGALPDVYATMVVEDAMKMSLDGLDVIFSAVETDAARTLETHYATRVPVVSTASAYRYEDDVPIIIPAVNGGHASLIDEQRSRRGETDPKPPAPRAREDVHSVVSELHLQPGL